MFCSNCGSELGAGAQFCSRCGSSQRIESGQGGASQVPAAAPAFMPAPGGKASTGRWIGQGWELVKTDLGNFVVMTILMLIVSGAVPFLLQGAMTAGFQGVCKKKLQGHRVEIADLFQGFQFFVPTLVAHLVISILIFVGILFFIIPGLVVAAMYNFTYLFIVDKRWDFQQAFHASASVVKQDYAGYTLFIVALGLLNIAGAVCLFVGLLVTIPISMAAVAVAYRDVVGFER